MPKPIKGWQAILMIDTGTGFTTIGNAESVSIDIDVALDEYFAIGKIFPVTVAPGAETVSGSLDKAWVDTDMLELIYGGDPDNPIPLPQFHIFAYQNISSGPQIYVWNCYAEALSVEIPADGFMTESLDFRGEYFTYGTKP